MPSIHLGVGRSNNFIEKFTASVVVGGVREQRIWTPIIPKSILHAIVDEDPVQ